MSLDARFASPVRVAVWVGAGAAALIGIAAGAGACAFADPASAGPPSGWWPSASGPGRSGLDASAPPKPESRHPDFGKTRTLSHAPPPITGGTLLLTHGGASAVAADPDRDRLYIVDVQAKTLRATIALSDGDEPGRLAEDALGRVHVALRRGGAVVTVDPATNAIVSRRSVCPAPRGIAYVASSDNLLIACNGGELVTLPAAGGAPTQTLVLEPDLRDVVVGASGSLYVSLFRRADVIELHPDGTPVSLGHAPVSRNGREPDVAWRMISAPTQTRSGRDTLAMIHQRAQPTPVSTNHGGYGQHSSGTGGCGETSIVESTITTFAGSQPGAPAPAIPAAVLPVDLAVSPDGTTFALVAAGNAKATGLPDVYFAARSPVGDLTSTSGGCASTANTHVPGQPVSVELVDATVGWVQTREPANLLEVTRVGDSLSVTSTVALSSDSREDTGHSIVHSNSGSFIACASCHAEGGDDGRVWQFVGSAALTPRRRTQSLRGTLTGTAPYHWEGDMTDVEMLAHEVFVKRMGGQELTSDEIVALEDWLFAVPGPLAPTLDAASVARGAALFASPAVGCGVCHSGPRFTNNLTMDVGTGGSFQVPSLVGVAFRAPYMHDGRAPQLVDRFNPALSGASHGSTSQLTTPEVEDLLHYLQSL